MKKQKIEQYKEIAFEKQDILKSNHSTFENGRLKKRIMKKNLSYHHNQAIIIQDQLKTDQNFKDRIQFSSIQKLLSSDLPESISIPPQLLKKNNFSNRTNNSLNQRISKTPLYKPYQQNKKIIENKNFPSNANKTQGLFDCNFKIRTKYMEQSPYIKSKQDIKKIIHLLKPVKGPTQSIQNQILRFNGMHKKTHELVLMRQQNENLEIKREKYLKRIGLNSNQKVFIFNSRDQHIKQALLERGWIELEDKWSSFFHLKWSYSDSASDYKSLNRGQFFNHFRNNQELTNKNNLRKNIKNMEIADQPRFPLTFDLGISSQYKQFGEYCSIFEAIKILNMIANQMKKHEPGVYQKISKNPNYFKHFQTKSKTFTSSSINKFDFSAIKLLLISNKIQNVTISKVFILMKLLIQYLEQKSTIKYSIFKNLVSKKQESLSQTLNFLNQILETQDYVLKEASKLLKVEILKLKFHFESSDDYSYGLLNTWIVKPTGVSRGAGIYIQSNYENLLSQYNSQHGRIIQKYIQKPLLLQDQRKFDIRQWVLVKKICPLEVYVFHKFYGRICPEKYTQSDFENHKKHLTNYTLSKQCYSKQSTHQPARSSSPLFKRIGLKKSVQRSTILQDQLKEYILDKYQSSYKWQELKLKTYLNILKTIKSCLNIIQNQQNCFQVYGFDIILDEKKLEPYILEVNLSPACQKRQGLEIYLKQMSHGLLEDLENELKLPSSDFVFDGQTENIFQKVWTRLQENKLVSQLELIHDRSIQEEKASIIQKFVRKYILKNFKT